MIRHHDIRWTRLVDWAGIVRMARFAVLLSALCLLPTTMSWSAPNFLVIVVDDQSPNDLRVYDRSSILETPNIDALAANGVVVDAAYHMGSFSGAVCTPSRHMIMSGRTVWHLPISPEAKAKNLTPDKLEEQTLAAVFRRAGYATMRTCKQGNSYEAANRQFEVRHDETKRGGTPETGSAWHAERVLDYLKERQSKADRRPFLIYYGFSHPHDERDGTPEFLARYGAKNHTDPSMPPALDSRQPPLPINWLPKHPFNNGHADVRDEVAVSGVWERRDEATIRNEIGRQFACSAYIDQQIGRVVDQLRDSGELEKTYIIYMSDHGMAIGRHGLQGKQNLYEHTWRVPFIVSGPGLPRGERVSGNVYLLDLLATLCDFAGIEAPSTNEGVSMRPVLELKQDRLRDVLYGVYNGGTKPGMRSVRSGDWKLLKYDGMNGTVRRTQLFNLATNPDELLAEHGEEAVRALTGYRPATIQRDLSDDPRYADIRARMEGLLLAEMRRLDDPWRLWDQPDDGLTPPADPPPRPAKAKK